MFPIMLTKEQFLSALSDMSENEMNAKISHYKEMLSLMEQVKAKNVTTDSLWYLSSQLVPNEKVTDKIQTHGHNLKVPKDIEVTNFGRVFYKGILLEEQEDSHGNFGVWYPHVGWRTKSNGISYHVKYEFRCLEGNNHVKTLYSKDENFFNEIESQWKSRCEKLSKNNYPHKKGDTFNKHSDTETVVYEVPDTSASSYEGGVYLFDGEYVTQEIFDSWGFD